MNSHKGISYFPVAIQPSPELRQYYLYLELINNANMTVVVKIEGDNTEIRIPYMGVTQVYEIINTITPPRGTMYHVYQEISPFRKLKLNGQDELNITPSLENQIKRIYIAGDGKKLQ